MTDNRPVELARALDMLERIHADLAAIPARKDDQRRQDLVKLRRALATQTALIGQLSDALFGTAGVEDERGTCRHLFSAMRSKAALHQASWPAVRMGEAPDEFLRSVRAVREANAAFIGWTRKALAELAAKRPTA